jgi:allophanate hydrolase subunit 2
MNIANEMIREVVLEVPEGHKHLRARLLLHDGAEFIFQEATIANIARAYITMKTHPQRTAMRLKGKTLQDRKPGFADYQLLED